MAWQCGGPRLGSEMAPGLAVWWPQAWRCGGPRLAESWPLTLSIPPFGLTHRPYCFLFLSTYSQHVPRLLAFGWILKAAVLTRWFSPQAAFGSCLWPKPVTVFCWYRFPEPLNNDSDVQLVFNTWTGNFLVSYCPLTTLLAVSKALLKHLTRLPTQWSNVSSQCRSQWPCLASLIRNRSKQPWAWSASIQQ